MSTQIGAGTSVSAYTQASGVQKTAGTQPTTPASTTTAPSTTAQPSAPPQDAAATGTYRSDAMSGGVRMPEISPETRQLRQEVSRMPGLPSNVSGPTLISITNRLLSKGFSDADVREMLQAIKDAGSDRSRMSTAIKDMAKAADFPFNNTLQSDARYDPSLSPRQVADMNREENRLVPIGEIWKKSVTIDAGVNIGSTNGERQTGSTGSTGGTSSTSGTAGTSTGNKISIGDIFNQKLLGMGIHFNYDNVKNTGGISIPNWLNERLQNASTEAEANQLVNTLIGHLSRAGVLPPAATTPSGTTGGSNGNGG